MIQPNVHNTVPEYCLQIWKSVVISKVNTEMKGSLDACTQEVSLTLI